MLLIRKNEETEFLKHVSQYSISIKAALFFFSRIYSERGFLKMGFCRCFCIIYTSPAFCILYIYIRIFPHLLYLWSSHAVSSVILISLSFNLATFQLSCYFTFYLL